MADGWDVVEELPDAAPAANAQAGGWEVVEETMPAAFGVKPRGIRAATNAPAPDKTDLTDAIGGAISAVVRPPKPDFKAANELARDQVQANPNATSLSGAELRQRQQGKAASDTFAADPWRAVGATVKSTPGMARSIMGGALRAVGEGPLAKIGGESGAIDPTGEFQGTVNSLGDMVARFGIDVADQGRAIEEEANKGIKRGLGGQIIDTAYRSALMAIPAAVVGLATRSPALVVSLMAGQDGALQYEEARQKGLDPTQAGGYAFLHALIEGGTEYIPMKELLKTDKNLLRHTLMFLAKEQPSELAATTLQSGLDKLTINPNMTAREFANELMMTALSTPLSAGAQTGAMRGLQTLLGASEPPPEAPQVAAPPPPSAPAPNPIATAAADLRAVMADARPLDQIRAEQAQQAQVEAAAQQDAIRQEAGFPEIGAPMIAKTPAGPLSGAVESIQDGENGPLAVFRTADGDIYRFAPGEVQFDAPTGDGSRAAPVVARDAQDVAIAAKNADTDATPKQKLADNYRKAWFEFDDTTPMVALGKIAIETPKGSDRTAADGSWTVPDMPAHYGHLSIAKGNDGDGADVFIGEKLDAPYVYVIDQIDPATGKYDETKSMVGFPSEGEAIGAYVRSFSDGKGPARIGAVTRMPLRQFVARAKADNLRNAVAYRQNTIDPKEIARERKPNPARNVADAVARRTEIDDTSLARMLDRAIESGTPDQVQALAEESIRRGHNFSNAEKKAIDTIVAALAKDQPAVTAAAEAAAKSPEPQDAALLDKIEEIANAEPENQAPAGTGRGEVQTAEAPATGTADRRPPEAQPEPAQGSPGGRVGADELRFDGRGIGEIPDGELRQIAGKTRTPKVLKAISDELARRYNEAMNQRLDNLANSKPASIPSAEEGRERARSDGEAAFRKGVKRSEVPYDDPGQVGAWFAGWDAAEAESTRAAEYRKNKIGARPPHEMSLADWSKEWAAEMSARIGEKVSPKAIGPEAHLDFIESALEEGKTVPDEAFKGHKAIDAGKWPLAAARLNPTAQPPAAAPAPSNAAPPAEEPPKVTAPTPAPKKRAAKPKAAQDRTAAIRDFYTPGNIVYSDYWRTHDRVLAYKADSATGWSVQVEKVAKKSKDGPWEAVEPPRWHSTPPDAKDVVVERAAAQAATAPPAESGAFAKGEMVTFSVPGPKGQMRIGGRIDRVMPTGAYEVRSQQGGIYMLMASDMTKVSQAMVPQIEQDIADAQWWDKELTHVGRKRVLKAAKLPNLPDSIQWQRLNGQEMRAVRANRAAADVEEAPAAPPKQPDRKEIGKNRDGATLYEDWRGVRTLVRPGETAGTTETVQMRPTRSGMQIVVMNSSNRPDEYKTVEELNADGQQDELPPEMRAYEAKAEAAEKAPPDRNGQRQFNRREAVTYKPRSGEVVTTTIARVARRSDGFEYVELESGHRGIDANDPALQRVSKTSGQSVAPPVAESQAPAPSEPGDRGVAPAQEAAPPAKSPEQLRAEADLMAGLADLADIFGKNAKLNMAPEQQQKIGPVLTRVFDAAFRLGYIKFKQAAKFVLDTIRTRIGAEVADQITIDDLQGAYIGMAQNYRDRGADSKKDVINVETLAELDVAPESAQNAAQESTNAPPQQPDDGPGSPQGEGAGPVSPTESEQPDGGVRDAEGRGAGGTAGKKPRRAPRKASPPEPQPQGGLFGEGAEPQPDRVDRDGAGDSDGAGLPEQRPSRNYRIADSDLTYEGSWLQKAKTNLDIIQLVKQLEQEGRPATPDEQALMVKYVGFGASELAQNLFTTYSQYDRSPWKELAERLKALLTEEEYQTAARSTQYAHYTSAPVIRSMYRGAARLGFAGGMVMEPGMGIGLFPGLMPAGMAKATRYTGIEYDGITGAIAKQLFPDYDIKVEDFSHTELPDNFYDLAIGNPPFSSVLVTNDPRYKKLRFSLHDYFFAKSIDRVKPGGLLIYVTSNSTMDKANDKARAYLAERAELLGAIRLPQTAFKRNAGTEVVTDVLFLQKKGDGVAPGLPWQGLKEVTTPEGPTEVNEYFAAHPEMVLGTHSLKGKMYRAGMYTVMPNEGEDIEAAFDKAIENLPKGVFQPMRGSPAEKAVVDFVDFNPKAEKDGNYYLDAKGALLIRESGVGKPVDMGPKANAILKSFVPLRDALKQAQYDQLNDGDWEGSLKALNKVYDEFVAKHGPVNQFTTQERTDKATGEVSESRRFGLLKTIADDPDWTLVAALERINDETGAITKSNFLTERTLKRPDPPKIETIHDALNVVLDQKGDVDIDAIAALMGVTPEQAIDGLGDAIYEEPGRGWQTADRYLSGKVRIKLAQAEAAARADKRFARNVTALKASQPVDVSPSGITARLGAPWVGTEDIKQFVRDVMQLDATVTHDDRTGSWTVKGSYLPGVEGGHQKATSDWGTGNRSAWDLLSAALNKNQVKVTYTDRDKKVHTDEKATAAANEKLRKINEAFTRWIWTEGERTDRLVKVYNERYNDFAPRKFNGDHLTLPGVSAKIKLRPHQKRAVWRIIQTGNTYVAHAVGAGKTMEMIAAGMEMRRLGIVKKPIYAVPNHMLQQFAREFLQLYPAAQIMVADETNFHTDNRRRFMARAALSNIDAIITTHSSFNMIDVKPEFKNSIIDEQLDILRDALEDVPKDERARRKQIERQIEALEKRLQGNLGGEGKDRNLTFEDMGVDFMFVDEAHEFRKLDFATNMGNIKGISPAGSAKAMNLYIKVRLLESKNPGRSLVLASGTPVTNTMAELFTLQRFMQPRELEEKGIDRFDAWASMFGVEASDIEATAAGNYEPVTRFSKFINLPELASMFREFADIITGAELGGLVDRPTVKGGGRQVNVTPRIPELVDYQEELKRRMVAIRARKGPPKAGDDILLSVIGDGRLASIDMRFVRPGLPSNPESKLNKLIDAVIETYHATADMAFNDAEGKPDPQRGATQLIFSDIGFGAGVASTRGFDGRAWLLKRLTESGIPREQIAFMSDFDTSIKKQRLFNDMNGGRKRILIGSSKNMGTGTNVQRRLAALHHLDAPWYPADIEQREGRAVRQGNQNPEVALEAYATKGSYDTTMWQMVARKQRFIDQVMRGDPNVRSMEDLGEASQYEMATALSSGDERIIRLAGLRADVEKLDRLYAAHQDAQGRLRRDLGYARDRIKWAESRIVVLKKDVAQSTSLSGDAFRMTVDGTVHNERAEAGKALIAKYRRLRADIFDGTQTIGHAGGFDIAFHGTIKRDKKGDIVDYDARADLQMGAGDVDLIFDVDADPVGTAMKVQNAIGALPRRIADEESTIAAAKREIPQLESRIGGQFEFQQELAEKRAEVADIENQLRAENEAAEAAGLPVTNFEALYGPMDETDVLGPFASRTARPGYTPPYTRPEAYKFREARDPNGLPIFRADALGLANARVKDALGVPKGGRALAFDIYDRMMDDGAGNPTLVGSVLVHMDANGKFASFRNIIIKKEFRDRGYYHGEGAVLGMLQHNGATMMEVYNIQSAARGDQDDALPFWKKIGTTILNYSTTQDVDIEGNISLARYTDAGKKRSVEYAKRQAGDTQAAQSAGNRNGSATGRTDGRGAPSAGAGRRRPGLAVAEVQRIAQGISTRLVRVVQSTADLPDAAARFKSDAGGIRGVFIPATDEIYLIADNLHSPLEVAFVVMHEGLHRGLRAFFGRDITPILSQIANTNARVRKAAAQYQAKYNLGRMEAIEEVLADMARDASLKDLTGWDKLVAFIRKWLASLGDKLGFQLKFSDAMVELLVGAAAQRGLMDEPTAFDDSTAAKYSRLSDQLKGMNKEAGTDLFQGGPELDGKEDRTKPPEGFDVFKEDDGTFSMTEDGEGVIELGHPTRASAVAAAWAIVSEEGRQERVATRLENERNRDEVEQGVAEMWDAANGKPLASRVPDQTLADATADLQPPRRGSFDNPFGGDAEFAGDLSLFKRIAVHPRTIAALDREFTPVYAVAESQVERRDQLAADILRHAQPYFDLNGEQKARVNAVLELGRLQGMTFGHDGTVQVMNMAENDAALSQPDDVLLLSAAEVRGYKAARKAMDRALDLFAERMIAEYGYTGQVRNAEEAAALSIEMSEANPRESGRLARLAEILFEVEQAKRTGYVPFTRWGEVGIAIKNAAGQQIAFERVEVDQWSNKARGLAEGLIPSLFNTRRLGAIPQVKERLAALKTRYPEGRVSVFRMDNPSAAGQVDLAAVDILASVSDIDPGQWDAVRAELEKAKQTTGFRKHFLGSRNVPGYSTDFERALADYILGISGYLSRHEHTPKWEAAIGAINSAKSKLIDYATRYRDYVNKPHEELQGLRQAAFFYFLSGVPATAMVNLTQVPLITMPYLTQFASATRVNMELARGYASALAMLTTDKGVEMFDPAKAPPDMMDAFESAWEQGFFVPLQTYEIMGLAQNRTPIARGFSKATRTVVDVVSLMFSLAERLNRIATFIAAYRLASTEGFGENARRIMADNPLAQQELRGFTPEAFAEWAIDETHYRMGKVNRPEAMRGVGAAILQFKGFMLNTLELYHRIGTLHGAEGKQAEALMLLLLLLSAGMYGLPGADDIADLIEFLMKRWRGIDYDTKARARQAIAELTGSPKIAEAVLHGAPRLAGGPDLASRLSMGNVVPNTMKDVAGVPLSLTVGKAVQAAEYAGRGQGMLAAAEIMPNFIKNPMTAYVWGREGIRAQGTGKVVVPPEKVSGGQQAMKAIGFTPAKVAEYREMQYSMNRLEHAADERRKSFYTRMAKAQGDYYRAQQAGDAAKLATAREQVEKVMREVVEWNAEADLENQVHFDPRTLRQRVQQEIMGPEAVKRRKQARGAAERLKGAYGQED